MSDLNKDTRLERPSPALVGAGQILSADILDDDLLDANSAEDAQARDLSGRSRTRSSSAPVERGPSRGVRVRQAAGDYDGFRNLLGNLKISRKLGLIVAAFLIPLLGLVTLFAVNQNRELAVASAELRGLEYVPPLADVLTAIPLHRDLSIRLLSGDTSLAAQLDNTATQVDTALAALARVQERNGSGLETDAYISELTSGWQNLEEGVLSLTPDVSFIQHSALISERVFPLLRQVSDRSSLGLDSNLGDYYLSKLTLETLPSLSESLSQLRDQGSGVLTRQSITVEERQTLSGLVNEIESGFSEIQRDMNIIAEGQPGYAQALNEDLAEFESLANYTVSLTRNNIINRFNTDILPATYFREATRSVEVGFEFLDESVEALTQDLNRQIASLRLARLLTFGGVLLALVLSVLLVSWIARQITRPVSELAEVARRVSQDDLSRFARVNTKDELGTLAASFNQTISRLRSAAEHNEVERQQNEALQRNVGQFLDVAMDIADGDFTKRGVVSEDVLGNVVDAINLMVDEVSSLLLEVRNAADSVARGSGGMLSTTQAISQTTTQQSSEAQKARQVTSTVSASMREMAQNARASAVAANQALSVSDKGRQAVEGTLQGMQNIRSEVQTISTRMQSLDERSSEISEIIDTISSISSQTNLLALNAAMEAAGAGPAGQRFAVVAGEVRKLAEDSALATQRVSTLIRDIQKEVRQVVGSVEDGSQQVEAGYLVATEAGARLQEVASIVQESAQFASSISDIIQAQVSQVENVDSSVRSIASLSAASQAQVQQGRESAEQLSALAEQLRQNLAHFRLA